MTLEGDFWNPTEILRQIGYFAVSGADPGKQGGDQGGIWGGSGSEHVSQAPERRGSSETDSIGLSVKFCIG